MAYTTVASVIQYHKLTPTLTVGRRRRLEREINAGTPLTGLAKLSVNSVQACQLANVKIHTLPNIPNVMSVYSHPKFQYFHTELPVFSASHHCIPQARLNSTL
jgi:hypothetical protein